MGFVFQSHKLIPHLTAYENILLPLKAAGRDFDKHEERFKHLVDALGIRDRLGHLPSELSGGQAQRVAIARALIHYPRILFADEPTGNLDTATRNQIHSLLMNIREQFGQTIVMVTHDMGLAEAVDRKIVMSDGQIL